MRLETPAMATPVLLSTPRDKTMNTTDPDIPSITVETSEKPSVLAVAEQIPTTLEFATISMDGESHLLAQFQEEKKDFLWKQISLGPS